MPSSNNFKDQEWKELVSIISASFSLNEQRRQSLMGNATAKLIAAIPFLAGCREPGRTALAHLATFMVACGDAGQRIFDHKASDNYDVLARLATVSHFEGGDPAIINKGMKLLARMMIEGYKKDRDSDKAKGLYNPVGDGTWDADEKLKSLTSQAAQVSNPEMESIVESAAGPWWMIS